MKKKLFFALAVVLAFVGARLAFSSSTQIGVENEVQHKKNKDILAKVIEKMLLRYPEASEFSQHIGEIGKEALKEQGFSLSTYKYKKHPDTGELCFVTLPMWEGRDRVPVTLFFYIWPSKEEALRTEKAIDNGYYASNIHSHPISCAFTVLQGSITQYEYTKDDSHLLMPVREVGKKKIHYGEQEVDLNEAPFIHQLVFEDDSKKPAITCHVYGKSTALEVMETFRRTRGEHVYLHVISKDGEIASRSW